MVSPEMLRRYPYFAPVNEDTLKQLAMMADERVIHAGEVLFDEGDPADNLLVLITGEVMLQYRLGDGEMRTVDTIVPGELFVWSAIVEPHHCTATGTATQETHVLAFDALKLRKLCDEDVVLSNRLATQMANLLSDRLEAARVQLATA